MKKTFLFMMLSAIILNAANAQSNDEKQVAAAVDVLIKTLVDPDKNTLEAITAPELSYGHSIGVMEDKATFIESLMSKKFDFISLNPSEQTIKLAGNTALVRHKLSGQSQDSGKPPGTVNLGVLLVWQKQQGKWKLLARQAFKL